MDGFVRSIIFSVKHELSLLGGGGGGKRVSVRGGGTTTPRICKLKLPRRGLCAKTTSIGQDRVWVKVFGQEPLQGNRFYL